MHERIVLTGASGHIGYHVARQLIEWSYKVVLLVRQENYNVYCLRQLGAEIVIVDFRDEESLKKVLQNTGVLFHIASENTLKTSEEKRIVANTFGLTKAVIDAAVFNKVRTIIYTSSVVVLGRSASPSIILNEGNRNMIAERPYVKGKMMAEDYCDKIINEGKADIRRIYPSWVVGCHDQKITPPHQVIKKYLKNGQWFYFKGGISVSGVEQVAKAHISAWLVGKPNERYITAGHNITFKDFYTHLAECTGYIKPFVLIPKWFALAISFVAKTVSIKSIPAPAYINAIIGNYSWYNSQKAERELGYTIPELSFLLKETIADLRTARPAST